MGVHPSLTKPQAIRNLRALEQICPNCCCLLFSVTLSRFFSLQSTGHQASSGKIPCWKCELLPTRRKDKIPWPQANDRSRKKLFRQIISSEMNWQCQSAPEMKRDSTEEQKAKKRQSKRDRKCIKQKNKQETVHRGSKERFLHVNPHSLNRGAILYAL